MQEPSQKANTQLSESQLRRIALNKARAKELLKVRVVKRGTENQTRPSDQDGGFVACPIEAKKSKCATIQSMRDSGGGFFIEEEELLADDGSSKSKFVS